jgi:N-acetylneuraminic acid mutarotase
MRRTRLFAANASKFRAVTGIFASILGVALAGRAIVAGRSPSSWSLQWTQSASFPEPRAGYAAGVLDGKLVIAGGTYWQGVKDHWTKKLYSASTHAFDPASQRWEKLPDLPIPLGYPAAAVVGNKLYVLGGYTGSAVNQKIFTLQKIGSRYTWSVLGNMSSQRIFASAVSVGKTIYLVGGTTAFEPVDAVGTCCTTNTVTSTLLAFDTDHPARSWQQLSSYPAKARWLPAVTSDGKSIWLFGGIFKAEPRASVTKFDEVLRYDLSQGKWYVMAPLPKGVADLQSLTSLAIEDRILLFTGQRNVWQVDLHTQQYAETTPMPQAVAVDQFFWLHQQIIGAGGESQIEGPRRRSPWTFIARLVGAGASP